jgi:hypothetical protein
LKPVDPRTLRQRKPCCENAWTCVHIQLATTNYRRSVDRFFIFLVDHAPFYLERRGHFTLDRKFLGNR